MRENAILSSPLPSFLSLTRPLNVNGFFAPPSHTHTPTPPLSIPPHGHWRIVCGSASILSNLITFLPFVVSGAGSFALWQWRSSHILWRCIPLIWRVEVEGVKRARGRVYRVELLPTCTSKVVIVRPPPPPRARVRTHARS